MKKQKCIAHVKRLFDEVYTQGNISLMDELFTKDVKLTDPAQPQFEGGLEGLKEKQEYYKQAFPSKTLRVDNIVSTEDDRVLVLWTAQGVQKGDVEDVHASGRQFMITGISIFTFKDEKIAEVNQNWDRLSMLEQLGAIEKPTLAFHR